MKKLDKIISENIDKYLISELEAIDTDGYSEANVIEYIKSKFLEALESGEVDEFDGQIGEADFEFDGIRFSVAIENIDSDAHEDSPYDSGDYFTPPSGGDIVGDASATKVYIYYDSEEFGDGEFEADDAILNAVNNNTNFGDYINNNFTSYEDYYEQDPDRFHDDVD